MERAVTGTGQPQRRKSPRFFIVCGILLCSAAVYPGQAESNDTDVLEQWRALEANLENFLNKQSQSVLRQVLPIIMKLDIETTCLSSLLRLQRSLQELNIDAFKLIDSSGRVAAGFIHGTMSDFGNFDECLSVRLQGGSENPVIEGQYCLAELRLPLPGKPVRMPQQGDLPLIGEVGSFRPDSLFEHFSNHSARLYAMAFRQGLCVPATCGLEDVRKMFTKFSETISLNGSVVYCHRRGESASGSPFSTLSKLVTIVVLVSVSAGPILVSVIKLVALLICDKKPEWLNKVDTLSVDYTLSKLFSSNERTSSAELRCVHGVRVISLLWVTVSHSYAYLDINSLANAVIIEQALQAWIFQPVANGWLVVDSFFCLSGFLLTYHTLRGERSWTQIPLKLALRYWRLIPLAMLILSVQFVFDDIFDGPMMPLLSQPMTEECKRSWWTLLLGFVRLDDEKACLPHLWYVAADLKLFFIQLPLSTLFLYRPRLAVGLHIVAIMFSAAFAGLTSWWGRLPPMVSLGGVDYALALQVASSVYADARTHLASYAIGSLAAYALDRYNAAKLFNIRKSFVVIGWTVSTLVGLAALVFVRCWAVASPDPIWGALYAALQRPLWSLTIGWLLFACCSGHGGIMSKFLGLRQLVPLSRISYAVYLCHAYVIYTNTRASHERKEASHYSILRDSAAVIVFATILALVATVLLEAPIIAVQRRVLAKIKRAAEPTRPFEVTCDNPKKSQISVRI